MISKTDIEKLRNELTKNDIYSLNNSLKEWSNIQLEIVEEAMKYRTNKNILFKEIPKGKVKQYLERMIDDDPYEMLDDGNIPSNFLEIIDSIINKPYYNLLSRVVVIIENKMKEINRVIRTLEPNERVIHKKKNDYELVCERYKEILESEKSALDRTDTEIFKQIALELDKDWTNVKQQIYRYSSKDEDLSKLMLQRTRSKRNSFRK